MDFFCIRHAGQVRVKELNEIEKYNAPSDDDGTHIGRRKQMTRMKGINQRSHGRSTDPVESAESTARVSRTCTSSLTSSAPILRGSCALRRSCHVVSSSSTLPQRSCRRHNQLYVYIYKISIYLSIFMRCGCIALQPRLRECHREASRWTYRISGQSS